MSTLTAPTMLFNQDLYTASTTRLHDPGTLGMTRDGRKFRYVSVEPSATTVTGQTAGATLVSGNLIQSSAQVANHLALTPSAAAIGATTITVTLGATAAFVNQYQGGTALVSTAPGNGIAYRIKSHPAAAASATLVLTLEEQDTVIVALTTASRVDLQKDPYTSVLQMPTTATGQPLGVALFAITAATTGGATGQTYGWIQTYGVCAALIQATPAVGASLMPSTTTAGALTTLTAGTPQLGNMMATGVNGKNNAVFLTID